jgi:hypothetical protein
MPQQALLQYTACTVVQRFACWLSSSALEDPSLNALIPPLLTLSIESMRDHSASGGAALAFSALCFNCAPALRATLPAMLQLLMEALAAETWKGHSTVPGMLQIEEEDVNSILEGVGTVVCVAINRGDAEVRYPTCFFRCFCQLVSVCRCCCSMWHV